MPSKPTTYRGKTEGQLLAEAFQALAAGNEARYRALRAALMRLVRNTRGGGAAA